MAHARLHIICGNCGEPATDGNLTHEICEGNDDAPASVYIQCANCSTLHNLADTVPSR